MSKEANRLASDESETILLRPSELKVVLADHAVNAESVLVFGPPGGGKSEIITQVAEDIELPMFAPYNLALCDGSEFKGVPKMYENYMRWVKEERWLVQDKFCVFLDEISQGPISAQNAVTTLLLENRIDDIYLPKGTWRVGAANRQQDRAGTNRMPNQLPNRCYVYELQYSAEDHVEFEVAQQNTDMLTIRFLRMKGDSAYQYDSAKMINPTPRAWSTVSRKLAQNTNTPISTIAGRIGKGFAAELFAFRDLAPSLPSPEEVKMNPKTARVPTDNTSALFLVSDMLADHASVNTFDALVEYAKRMPEEFQACFVKAAIKRKPEVLSTKAFTQWAIKFQDVLK